MLPRAAAYTVVALFLVCGRAGAAFPVTPRPLPVPGSPTLVRHGTSSTAGCLPVYLNETTSTLQYFPPGAGLAIGDDLHTTAAGMQILCGFDFGYFKPDPGTVDATVTFYDDTSADPDPGDVIAGPFSVPGLPSGLNAFHIDVPGGFVDDDVWMAVAFSDDQTGLLLYGPPTLGTSHDLAWMTGSGRGNFGGDPAANFFLGAFISAVTPARSRTWGGLKLIYR